MSTVIKIRKGLDINLVGSANKALAKAPASLTYALMPDDYIGVVPKMLVKVGDAVDAGSPLFFDKENPDVVFVSPVSGTVTDVVRGDKRKLLSVVVTADGANRAIVFSDGAGSISSAQAREMLLKSGLWSCLKQRPFGTIARPDGQPKAIFVSGLDTAPLAPDLNFAVQDQADMLKAGVNFLKLITGVDVHLTVDAELQRGVLKDIDNVVRHTISGPHPAGNVGVQIAAVSPIGKGDLVWTVDIQHLAMIGRLAVHGTVDMTKVVALAGSGVRKTQYLRIVSGASVESLLAGNINAGNYRVISGNPLTGSTVCESMAGITGHIGFYHNQLSVIPEGDKHELFGWAMPRLHRFSFSRSYFSWLQGGKASYDLDTNTNGGSRAFVMNGVYERVMPMDIYPVYLLKAIMAGDIDKMENLGIYEVIEEDMALCEFVCPSKIEWQSILREGINKMIKEL